jgi:uncharacterized protein YdcH (DUF465 family)
MSGVCIDELRAEVERLKAENTTFRNAQMCCEACDDAITVESLREFRADKARLDWLSLCREALKDTMGHIHGDHPHWIAAAEALAATEPKP